MLRDTLIAAGELDEKDAIDFTFFTILVFILIWPLVLFLLVLGILKGEDGEGPDNFAY